MPAGSDCRDHARNRGGIAMNTVSRREAKDLIEERKNLTIVETLGAEYFRKFHLPDARNDPFENGFDGQSQTVAPDDAARIRVDCLASDGESAAKAARRLVELGDSEV